MSFRRFATGAALAIAGLAAAVGIGLLANTISGDSVGLGAEPLSAGETLAPATAKADDGKQHQRQRNRNRGGDDARTTTSPTLTDELAPATPPTVTDDHGGDRSGSDDGSNSGSGSSGSGSSGSSGSSSSGSGSSGSDDSGKIDD
jgi:hypothetical protein